MSTTLLILQFQIRKMIKGGIQGPDHIQEGEELLLLLDTGKGTQVGITGNLPRCKGTCRPIPMFI